MSNITASQFKFYNEQKGEQIMDEKMISKIMDILKNGDKVELIPVKSGIKVLRIRRDEVKA